MVPNVPLASTPGKKLHPSILSTLAIHGGQIKIETNKVLIFYMWKLKYLKSIKNTI